ncbi:MULTISPECIES: transposase [Microbacterium]|uniref:IS110 family transposase n=1 Tax=Microbacterium TaxID=33882 RepID=UPI002784DEB7|nr:MULTISPECIES: transposase [Microbacterium]MDQ1076350.1 transposase [Microbacterium sp. SORGH_AS_0969]MDQ1116587.1 transposase [Microbacterium testaceum]
MTNVTLEVVGGVDTHADTHHAAVVDTAGRQLADRQFPTTEAGYVALIGFLVSFGTLLRVGVEGTGSYGAGLARALRARACQMVCVRGGSPYERKHTVGYRQGVA